MIIVGLTGSIAMGKSLTGSYFKQDGIPVFDADAVVHQLYASDSAVIKAVGHLCSDAIVDGKVDRHILARYVYQNGLLKKIEAIVHPEVKKKRDAFLATARKNNESIVVLDIPLLFETGVDALCDRIIVVKAPWYVQMKRALRRKKSSLLKFLWLNSKQLSSSEKCEKADFVINTNQSKHATFKQVKEIIAQLRKEVDNGKKTDRT